MAYSAWDDMSDKWWDPSANGWDEAGLTPAGGYYRQIDSGKRYGVGSWPASEPASCDTPSIRSPSEARKYV